MVELVAVILIAGLLAAIAGPRFFGEEPFAERGFFEELVAAARYAQKRAVAAGCPVRIDVTANDYTLRRPDAFCADNFNATVTQPGTSEPFTGTAPDSGIGGASIVDFQPSGSASADATWTVGGHTIVVHAATGYVEVQ